MIGGTVGTAVWIGTGTKRSPNPNRPPSGSNSWILPSPDRTTARMRPRVDLFSSTMGRSIKSATRTGFVDALADDELASGDGGLVWAWTCAASGIRIDVSTAGRHNVLTGACRILGAGSSGIGILMGAWAAVYRGWPGGDPAEGRQDAQARPQGPAQAAGYLRGAAGPAMIRNGYFENTQSALRGAHLHFDVPAIAHFAHAEIQQQLAPNGPKCAHVRIGHAVENMHGPAGQRSGCDLMPGDAAGLALAQRARSDDEIVLAGANWCDQRGVAHGVVRAVAVHEDDDRRIVGRLGGPPAGAAVALAGVDHLRAGLLGPHCRRIAAAAVGDNDAARERARHAGNDVCDRGLFVQRRYGDNHRPRTRRRTKRA